MMLLRSNGIGVIGLLLNGEWIEDGWCWIFVFGVSSLMFISFLVSVCRVRTVSSVAILFLVIRMCMAVRNVCCGTVAPVGLVCTRLW